MRNPLADRLRRRLQGQVRFDDLTRGLYSTDASIYQISPIGVVFPRDVADIAETLRIARDEGVPVIPRGAGTSQSGQAIGRAIIVDTSRSLTAIGPVDHERRTVAVQPGVVLDRLNQALESTGLFFPVDISTASRATLGGMTGNNSAGARSIRYGVTVDNVRSIRAILADGTPVRFDRDAPRGDRATELARSMGKLRAGVAEEIASRVPRVARNVAGYNLRDIDEAGNDLVKLLVGSEGTLAFFTEIELDLVSRPAHTVLGVCGFGSLTEALDSVQHIVTLDPTAVELVDGALIDLARRIPVFSDAIDEFVVGDPRAVLLVEFSGEEAGDLARDLDTLRERLGDLAPTASWVRAEDAAFQARIWGVRKAAMNVVMSMKGDGKPVSFIEDCAVPLEHLAEYAARLTEVFERHGTEGTWYAHASVGCLHVRPTLNLKLDQDLDTMRRVADEAHELVREFGGSHSGEHGDGIVRSEFLTPMLGSGLTDAFATVKDTFDPQGVLNPGKIVRPPRMNDRNLLRYGPGYRPLPVATALDWSEWGGLHGAVEMCNNNGACRKFEPGVMCPSFRATEDERDSTRGRANALRLAMTGQMGAHGLGSDEVHEAMELCVGCKACKRECPTGVDMARMKIEHLHQYHARVRRRLRDYLVAYLPRYAPYVSSFARLANALGRLPGRLSGISPGGVFDAAGFAERVTGLTFRAGLPQWHRRPFREPRGGPVRAVGAMGDLEATCATDRPTVLLWVDTFSRYLDSDVPRAAERVLQVAGYDVRFLTPVNGGRALCCGRTFLNAGMVDEAREEMARLIAAIEQTPGCAVVGLEPSCLLTLRDELPALFPGEASLRIAGRAMLFEEFLVKERSAGRFSLELNPTFLPGASVHGHCHEKAFGVDGDAAEVLGWIPGLEVQTIESSCCGMAGSFGYETEHLDVSLRMGELSLGPALREMPENWAIVADGTSCRAQIHRLAGARARHLAEILVEHI